jgi:hypothetical protein
MDVLAAFVVAGGSVQVAVDLTSDAKRSGSPG